MSSAVISDKEIKMDYAVAYDQEDQVAIIGMAGRFPGARNVEQFWLNLRDGVESISFFTDQELLAAGVDPALLAHPNYVKAGGVLEDIEYFDAGFFGFNPREAEITDPQQRLFLECAWEAMENAGYDTERYEGAIGVYAGVGMNTYLLNLYTNRELMTSLSAVQVSIGNDKDHLATRVSYKLNLTGPSITVQTACSTSLVAVHLACQSLLNGECDMAMAGGATVAIQQKSGYIYQEGGILSPDGHCRTFDAAAAGTVGGSGVGIVILKRLSDAIADGDHIEAVIKGSAINNDGALKVGYTAPGSTGQASVIAEAFSVAQVEPETLGYIEAHGTATSLGDPIEFAALTHCFRASSSSASAFCAIGSVKSNIGHLDTAAGVAGLIKTTLALKHKQIPPSLHFSAPNPQIDFSDSPFYVNTALQHWPSSSTPRRAGVSSFGIGGTNAHLLLEEAPTAPLAAAVSSAPQLLLLSARSNSALEKAVSRLSQHLSQHPELSPADVAYTLQVGRRAFSHRRAVLCHTIEDAITALDGRSVGRVFDGHSEAGARRVVMMFSGQGGCYPNMGLGLYQSEPRFREVVDECAALLMPHLGLDLRQLLYPGAAQRREAEQSLSQTWAAQPALFVIEYALAKLWMSWGVQPAAMIGHSIGEYVAACLSGVFELADGLRLVAARGRLMQEMERGAMLAVMGTEAEVTGWMEAWRGRLWLGAVNTVGQCVVSGEERAIEELEAKLTEMEVASKRLKVSHAFHSGMMERAARAMGRYAREVEMREPEIAYISNVTGGWASGAEVGQSIYWGRQMRETVRWREGMEEVLRSVKGGVLLEVGPGQTLSRMARMAEGIEGTGVVWTLAGEEGREGGEDEEIKRAVGKLWVMGVEVEWEKVKGEEKRRRVELPGYAFERERYWIERGRAGIESVGAGQGVLRKKEDIADWFYVPVWKQSILPVPPVSEKSQENKTTWLVFMDASGLTSRLVKELEQDGHDVISVTEGQHYARLADTLYSINPLARDDYDTLLMHLQSQQRRPQRILHCWSVSTLHALSSTEQVAPNGHHPADTAQTASSALFDIAQQQGFYSLVYLAQALGKLFIEDSSGPGSDPLIIEVLSSDMQEVSGDEPLDVEKATLLGACRVIPQEYPHLRCRSIDVVMAESGNWRQQRLVEQLAAELKAGMTEEVVAYRGQHRWVQNFEAVRLEAGTGVPDRLRIGGVYLITGGTGGIGLEIARYLAETVGAKVVLVSRRGFVEGEEKRRRVEEIERAGGEVLILKGDVSDEGEMDEVIKRAKQRYGEIHGVIHAAGVTGGASARAIQETNPAEAQLQFQPKIFGLLALEKVLRGENLDFVLLLSSLSSVLGGLGFTSYAAANIFMDAFAHRQSQISPVPWLSINWDGWNLSGSKIRDTAIGAGLAELAITPQEGMEALRRILLLPAMTPQIVVSTGDLQIRIDRWIKQEALTQSESAEPGEPSVLHPRPELQNAYVAPRNEREETVTAMLQKLLGISQIGVYDDFFELGGHSLLATQVISRIRDVFHVNLSLRGLFETPNVAGMVESIELAMSAEPHLQAPPLKRVSRDEKLPLSFGQQRLWFLNKLQPDSIAYNLPGAVRLTGQLNIDALEQTLGEIIRRHEVLRTTFSTVNGQPVALIREATPLALPILDLSALPEADREVELRRLATEEAQRPFDLTQGPLLRVSLVRTHSSEHVALVTMHHIVSDGWSPAILVREMMALYEAYSTGQPSPLPELTIQYADFAHWQREWLQGEVLEAQLSYWRQQLDGAAQTLELPTDRPRPAVQSFNGAEESLEFSPELTERLGALSRQEGVTLFMTLLAAFQTLLSRYSRQKDIVVGSPIANRTRAELEGLIGFFVNTLVLRTSLRGEPSFRELLTRVREVALGAYAHQDVPFEMLVEELQPERDMSRSPLFQVMFVLQNTPAQALELPALRLNMLDAPGNTAKFDLTLTLVELPDGLRGRLEYNTDLFDRSSIQRLISSFHTLVEGLVTYPDHSVSSLPLLSPAELHQLLHLWNDTAAPFSQHLCLHQLFEQQVQRSPDAAAVVYDGRSLSYAELNARANQLAHHLLSVGITPGSLVALCLERAPEMVITLLAILKAGAAYLPLDPTYPQERLQLMLSDVPVSLLITSEQLREGLPAHRAPLLAVDTDAELIATHSTANPIIDVTPEHLAYGIYTSGSTGRPKAAGVYHRGVVNLLEWYISEFSIEASDRVLLITSLSFDLTQKNIYAPLLQGATLYLPPTELYDAQQITSLIEDYGITLLNCTPSAFYPLIEHGGAGGWKKLRTLREVFLGGEGIAVGRLKGWQEWEGTRAEVVNTYGPTECTDVVAYHRLGEEEGVGAPIGRPVRNTRLYVLDEGRGAVPVGAVGEIYIGGVGVGAGYLGDAEKTAEKFVADELSGGEGERLYRTGDLGKYRSDGAIEYVGRIDQQVKVRGYRIELGEVEAVVSGYEGVKEAVVEVRGDGRGERRLVAYVVWEDDATEAVAAYRKSALRQFLRGKLPEYMVPGAFVEMEQMPLTPSGKVDRKKLEWREEERDGQGRALTGPRNGMEKKIAGVWAAVLGVERVGVDENFFDIGGHSLLMVEVHSRMEEEVGAKVSMMELFQYPTIEALAKFLEHKQDEPLPFQKIHDRAEKQKEALNRQRQLIKQKVRLNG